MRTTAPEMIGHGGDDRVDGHAGAARFAENELGRRILPLAGAHGPRFVVEVEDGRNGSYIHVGVEIGFERTDIAPVERVLLVLIDGELVGGDLVAAENAGQDVVPEVVLGVGIFGIFHQRGRRPRRC